MSDTAVSEPFSVPAGTSLALEVEAIEVRRGGRPIISGLTLGLEQGASLAILGRNGAGKTTLAEAIAGLLPVSAGKISLRGVEVTKLPAHRVAKLGVALVPETRALFTHMTVFENLALGAHTRRWRWGGPPLDAFENVWHLFPQLADMQRRRVGTLSGGQQQMVAVGRALMSSPTLLILDEPSAGLSPQAIDGMRVHLQQLLREGYSILLVEQNADLALDVCHEVAILAQGHLVRRGPAELVSQERVFLEALFGDVETRPDVVD